MNLRPPDPQAEGAEFQPESLQLVTETPPGVCPSVCPSDAESGHETCTVPAATDGFAEAVQAIMRLPLSDDEKAEALRRLLASEK